MLSNVEVELPVKVEVDFKGTKARLVIPYGCDHLVNHVQTLVSFIRRPRAVKHHLIQKKVGISCRDKFIFMLGIGSYLVIRIPSMTRLSTKYNM